MKIIDFLKKNLVLELNFGEKGLKITGNILLGPGEILDRVCERQKKAYPRGTGPKARTTHNKAKITHTEPTLAKHET